METGKRSYEAFWKQAVADITVELSEQELSTWFRGIEYAGCGETHIVLSVPSSFYKDQITQRYLGRLEEKLAELAGNPVTVKFTIQKKAGAKAAHDEGA